MIYSPCTWIKEYIQIMGTTWSTNSIMPLKGLENGA
jgi:hypothetical protein